MQDISHFWPKSLLIRKKVVNLHPTEPATLPVDQRTRAGRFVYIRFMRYNKQPISIANQIAILKSRGMVFGNEFEGSFRLGEYKLLPPCRLLAYDGAG